MSLNIPYTGLAYGTNRCPFPWALPRIGGVERCRTAEYRRSSDKTGASIPASLALSTANKGNALDNACIRIFFMLADGNDLIAARTARRVFKDRMHSAKSASARRHIIGYKDGPSTAY